MTEETLCKKCGVVTEHKRRGARQYRYCVPCLKRIQKAYYARNRERLQARFRARYADPAVKAIKNAQSRRWHKANMTRSRNLTRAWRLKQKLQKAAGDGAY